MTLREAEQRCPQAVFRPVDHGATSQLQTALLRALYRFSPALAAEDPEIFLGLDGLALQWPDRAALLKAVERRVEERVGVKPALGLGVNRFVSRLAAAAARVGDPIIVAAAATAEFLAPLPISVLPLDEQMHTYLELCGLRTLGALRTLTRVAWQRQFGSKALALYDLAGGIDPRPLPLWRPPRRIQETLPLDPPLDNVEALQFVLRTLIDRLGEALVAGGLGTRRIVTRLDQDGGGPLQVETRFAYPVTAAAELFQGIRASLLRARPSSPLERVTLTVKQLEPAYSRQPGLLLRRDGHAESLADAVLRLQDRYRPELVQRASLTALGSPLVERQVAWRPA